MTRTFLAAAVLSTALAVQASAQSKYGLGGTVNSPSPTPAPVVPTPPPVTPPPVTPPPVTPPPVAPVYSSPLLLGQSSSGQVPTLDSVFTALSSQITNYNNYNPFDLSQATLNGASQTLVSSSNTPPPSTGGSKYSLGGGTSSTPTPPPSGPTSINIDVTGWSYLVLQWGSTNYHFYVGDTSGLKTFTGSAPLSSYTFFTSAAGAPDTTSVPDGLSTLAALSFAAAIMGLLRRYWDHKK